MVLGSRGPSGRRTITMGDRRAIAGSALGIVAVVAIAVLASLQAPQSLLPAVLWLTGFCALGIAMSLASGGRRSWTPVVAGLAAACLVCGIAAAVAAALGFLPAAGEPAMWPLVGALTGAVMFILAAPPLGIGMVLGGLAVDGLSLVRHLGVAAGGPLRAPAAALVTESVAKPTVDWSSALPTIGVLLSAGAALLAVLMDQVVWAVALLAGGSFVTGLLSAIAPSRTTPRGALIGGVLALPVALIVLTVARLDRGATGITLVDLVTGVACLCAWSSVPLLAGHGTAIGVGRVVAWRRGETLAVTAPSAARGKPLSVDLARAIADGAATTVIRRYPPDTEGEALLASEAQALAEHGYSSRSVVRRPGKSGTIWRVLFLAAALVDLLLVLGSGAGLGEWIDEHRRGEIVATFDRTDAAPEARSPQ